VRQLGKAVLHELQLPLLYHLPQSYMLPSHYPVFLVLLTQLAQVHGIQLHAPLLRPLDPCVSSGDTFCYVLGDCVHQVVLPLTKQTSPSCLSPRLCNPDQLCLIHHERHYVHEFQFSK
jgi:hypothetical protein